MQANTHIVQQRHHTTPAHTHTQALLRTFYPPQAGLRPGHSSALTGSPAQDPGKRGKNGNSKPRKNSLGPTIISIGDKEEGGAGGDREEWAPCSKCFRKAFGRELPLEPVSGILTVLLSWLLSHHAGGKGLSSGLPVYPGQVRYRRGRLRRADLGSVGRMAGHRQLEPVNKNTDGPAAAATCGFRIVPVSEGLLAGCRVQAN